MDWNKQTVLLFAAGVCSAALLSGCRTEVMAQRKDLAPATRDYISDYPGKQEDLAQLEARRKAAAEEKKEQKKPQEITIADGKTEETKPAVDEFPPMEPMESKPIVSSEKSTASGDKTAAGVEGVYVVVKNDNLSRIAKRNGTTVGKLAAYNNIDRNAPLKVGQKLRIPGKDYKGASAAAGSAAKPAEKTAVSAPAAKEQPADGLYIVKPGDSIDRIARRYGVKRSAMLQTNHLTERSILRVGQKLVIPGGAADKGGVSAAAPAPAPAAGNSDNTLDGLLSGLSEQSPAKAPESGAGAAVSTPAPVSAPAAIASSAEVLSDTSAAEFAKRYDYTVEQLKAANTDIWPADGILKAGTLVVLP